MTPVLASVCTSVTITPFAENLEAALVRLDLGTCVENWVATVIPVVSHNQFLAVNQREESHGDGREAKAYFRAP